MELKIERLSKTYPNGVHALRDVSLTIAPGMFGLLGPNGAGKSTLMRILATLQEADSGRVRLGEIDVLRDKDAVRRTLGYLPQEFGLYPRATAEEMLDHFAVLKGVTDGRERREVVHSLLEQTNLWDARARRLGTFSGGMRQRFGIAVALIGNPRLIIVDEPTAGLDPAERARFLNLLSELGENAVVILSTHIVEDVSDLCQRMAIIREGQILLEAEPQAAVRALRGRVWRREVPREELKDFSAAHQVISTMLVGGRTVVHVHGDTPPDGSFQPVEPDLKDVYFTVMGRIGVVRTAQQTAAAEPAAWPDEAAPDDSAVDQDAPPRDVAQTDDFGWQNDSAHPAHPAGSAPPRQDFAGRDDSAPPIDVEPPRDSAYPNASAPPRQDFAGRDDSAPPIDVEPPRDSAYPNASAPPRQDFARQDDSPQSIDIEPPRDSAYPYASAPPRQEFARRDDSAQSIDIEPPRDSAYPNASAPPPQDFARRDDSAPPVDAVRPHDPAPPADAARVDDAVPSRESAASEDDATQSDADPWARFRRPSA